MIPYNLEQGQGYILSHINGKFPNESAPKDKVVYVRKENLPKEGGDWETFYTYFGGNLMETSEGLVREEGILLRLRVPANGIVRVDGERVIVDGQLVERLIIDDKHPKIVNEWLKEVKKIKEGKF